MKISDEAYDAARSAALERWQTGSADTTQMLLSVFAGIEAAAPYLEPAGDGGLREALEDLAGDWTLGVTAVGPATLRDLLAAHPAAPAVPQPVDREAVRAHLLKAEVVRADGGYWDTPTPQEADRMADAVLAVLAGEQEQVEP